MVPIAHGNDAGGSIRIPAACCGVFGLKPTRARVPLGPHYGDLFSGLVAEHALTISVRDSAALLDATAGPMVGDPYWAPPARRPFVEEVGFDPGPLRIGVMETAPLGTEIHEDCVAAVQDAAALCAELGHFVEEAAPSYDERGLWLAFTKVMAAGFAWSIADLGPADGPHADCGGLRAAGLGLCGARSAAQRGGVSARVAGPPAAHARRCRVLQSLRHLAHAHPGPAAGADGRAALYGGRPVCLAPAERGVRARSPT